jgi:hypothetical protein
MQDMRHGRKLVTTRPTLAGIASIFMVTQDEQAPLAPRAWSCQPFATLMSTPITRLLVTVAAAVALSGGLFAQPAIVATNTQLTAQRQQAIAELESDRFKQRDPRFDEQRNESGRATTCTVRASQPVPAKGDERSVH